MKLPRVMAVHDMSGFGKCSLTVAIPVISACGAEVCPLPTALLSAHTDFKEFTLFDFTPEMDAYLASWEKIGIPFDAVYSGFLGSAAQIDTLLEIKRRFSPGLMVVDPVMGDNGRIYKTYTPEMCEKMKSLAAVSDILTPNLTEACTLTGQEYAAADCSPAGLEALCRKIRLLGAKTVVLTGVERNNQLVNCLLSGETYSEHIVKLLPYKMFGTGDLFASVLTGKYLTEQNLSQSVDFAAHFVLEVMELSAQIEDAGRRGPCFEPLLYRLAKKITLD